MNDQQHFKYYSELDTVSTPKQYVSTKLTNYIEQCHHNNMEDKANERNDATIFLLSKFQISSCQNTPHLEQIKYICFP